MYDGKIPEDSTLRRHYESAAALAHAGDASTPTDSVLRRHYEQMHNVGPATAPAAAAKASPKPAPRPAAKPAAPPRPAAPAESGGGFFGWLKRLFG